MQATDRSDVDWDIGPGAILVPLDGSDLAARAAYVGAKLAGRLSIPLTLMTATGPGPDGAADRYLAAIAAKLPGATAQRLVIEHADAAAAVTSVALELDEPLVCMTTHGRGGIRWAVLGSVAEDVSAQSARPVVLLGPHCVEDWTPDAGRILLCHDGSRIPDGLVELAVEWSELLEAPLSVLTVVHPLDVESAEHPDEVFTEIVGRLAALGHDATTKLVSSRYAAGALADAAASQPTALLVMATHHRHGFARAAIGSTTIGTVGLSPCPAVVLPSSRAPG